MTKHIGSIIAWIIIAGVILYAARHFSDIVGGVTYVKQSIDEQEVPDAVELLFK
ncbi:MAG: hypothetical protein UY31_C0013G0015 [Candidatus Wolfebacteria bacterium GW2011_GWE1_48_7]|uniref:Uncharacterized protein n=2 Tax=Candidatus Wolfeibacteriota TaxID=1752735 RepID=A0A0G1X7V2_9BACT|nr:MAG: hypothetical protein UX70_C0001G0484 [Candidatus Wolfebacteria bacterium GW2011_GWB1_47_1]KKU37156.1 MAG: hypothetical protein UX49_C0001G0026 [Candidatus Wolfebacteria bacterium GW2011_GWC2_46_275]KKU42684.1 MAG: hypothetical protein UX58_C0001G0116 [Candidatus Wolfebacteria bacterium GW2011_GWB2_46_69]KKU54581.1 MAG: hypothetical protein UX76_C0001G0040 [Candidatus Wolfebacteria bacterium GW2011_GWC1_47_103]KKU59965.1 MAG: hypothetical protein UX83_C0001G0040 [Candidatus Wolfebacteria